MLSAESFLSDPEHISCMDYGQLETLLSGFRSVRRHGLDVFLEPPIPGMEKVIPYSIRRRIAQTFVSLEKILVVEAVK